MAGGGEHAGAQRVDRLHAAQVADDTFRLSGQLLAGNDPTWWAARRVTATTAGLHQLETQRLAALIRIAEPNRPHPLEVSSPGRRMTLRAAVVDRPDDDLIRSR
jgi:hypothetical protein